MKRQRRFSVVLYFIGPGPAFPVPFRGDEGSWVRRQNTADKAVFLSDQPEAVGCFHCKHGNVYAYRVPMWVIAASGGLVRYDSAREVLISEELWPHVRFIGRSYEATSFSRRVRTLKGTFSSLYFASATVPRPPAVDFSYSRVRDGIIAFRHVFAASSVARGYPLACIEFNAIGDGYNFKALGDFVSLNPHKKIALSHLETFNIEYFKWWRSAFFAYRFLAPSFNLELLGESYHTLAEGAKLLSCGEEVVYAFLHCKPWMFCFNGRGADFRFRFIRRA